jgi:hypothetical protein
MRNHLCIFGAGSSKDFGFPLGNEFFEKSYALSLSPQEKIKSERSKHFEKNLGQLKKYYIVFFQTFHLNTSVGRILRRFSLFYRR